LLANVWCGQCARETTVTDFSGRIQRGDLLLTGRCARCGSEVARVIEGE
jgi:Zn finger protein HypA/HybF involved in hydrogenase expression